LSKSKDTLHVIVSDFHSGSNYALFPNHEWHGRKTSHTPRALQVKIYKHFLKFCEVVKERRKDKRVVLVHNGDALDGDHHNSGDVCSTNSLEQADIHIELMNELQKRIGWTRGDMMYYSKGTRTHVGEFEDYIARELNAQLDFERGAWEKLDIETNGVLCTFYHHGPGAGDGANEGNAMRSWLRNNFYDSLKDGSRYSDVLYTGHVHVPTYAAYTVRDGHKYKNIHGVILPSWQGKTPFSWKVASRSRNKIGGVIHEIKADGTVCVPEFILMETE